ncbi:MAG: bifunctional pyr operon transcriptional regulator/uracil phosphoribosyltransferase PyrR [Betaproteobacteria bacterium]|nr:bifunctional pyr operon transcriptional regulator/uracil phosphoribosyltransferase PyrR [Betaproteobacteria bacterium]
MKLPDAEQLLEALAAQLRPHVDEETGLVGIHTGGVWVAERLHSLLGMRLPLGTLDIAFYRDDFDKRGLKPGIQASKLAFDVEGRDIILVDDILYTGRTARAALNLLFDYGRPGCVRLAALLDRGGRQLPICAQFVGGVLELPPHTPMVVLAKTSNGRLALTLEESTDAR